jgi:Fe-S-cluster-containing dehydrogenase component
VRTWSDFVGAIRTALVLQRAQGGAGLRILTERITSPSTADLLESVLREMPQARWHQWEPVTQCGARDGLRQAFGRDVDAVYRFDQADVVVSLDADFLSCGPGNVRYAHDFTSRRRAEAGSMSRLYVVETGLTSTGSKADHRLPLRPSQVEAFARALASALGVGGAADTSTLPEEAARWVSAIAADLRARNGRALVVPGDQQSPAVHVLAHAMNAAIGAAGTTVTYVEPVEARPTNEMQSLRELTEDLDHGIAQFVLILGGNPVFTAPADFRFAEKLTRAQLAVYLGPDVSETAELCHWNVPEAHYLESWGDARAYDGTVSIIQPLIAPLYGGRTVAEVLTTLTDRADRTPHAIVQEYWTGAFNAATSRAWTILDANGAGFPNAESFWRAALHDGFIRGTHAPEVSGVSAGTAAIEAVPASGGGGLEIMFRPDPTIWDGRFANNGWLQELPKPITSLTWDAAAYIAPATADRLGLRRGDVVALDYKDRGARMPVFIVPGHAQEAVTVHFGYGRRVAGRIGANIGFDAFPLRGSDAPWSDRGLEVVRTGRRYDLASTQNHFLMEDRDLVRSVAFDQYAQNPEIVQQMGHKPPPRTLTLYPQVGHGDRPQRLHGCNACVVACQPRTTSRSSARSRCSGPRDALAARRRYFEGGDPDEPAGLSPAGAVHAVRERAVRGGLPGGRDVHSDEGLNDMVYNRCVGTRYCSNNCPYKVRRFNFLLYQDWTTPSLKAVRNPDVTVRSRGVMEKCTYCVQRINQARIEAKKEDRPIRDGEIVTACQAGVPGRGDRVRRPERPGEPGAKLKAQQRNYGCSRISTRGRARRISRRCGTRTRSSSRGGRRRRDFRHEGHGYGERLHWRREAP